MHTPRRGAWLLSHNPSPSATYLHADRCNFHTAVQVVSMQFTEKQPGLQIIVIFCTHTKSCLICIVILSHAYTTAIFIPLHTHTHTHKPIGFCDSAWWPDLLSKAWMKHKAFSSTNESTFIKFSFALRCWVALHKISLLFSLFPAFDCSFATKFTSVSKYVCRFGTISLFKWKQKE